MKIRDKVSVKVFDGSGFSTTFPAAIASNRELAEAEEKRLKDWNRLEC